MATTYPTTPGVTFKDIPGFPGYCAGDDGTIWTRKRQGTRRLFEWRERKISTTSRSCRDQQIDLVNETGDYKFRVGRLILSVFIGPCPVGMECCHNDGNPGNCRLDNLRWDTHFENMQDTIRHGTVSRGERCPHSKLTDAKVREAFRLQLLGWKCSRIARRLEVGQPMMSRVLRRQRWKHVEIS